MQKFKDPNKNVAVGDSNLRIATEAPSRKQKDFDLILKLHRGVVPTISPLDPVFLDEIFMDRDAFLKYQQSVFNNRNVNNYGEWALKRRSVGYSKARLYILNDEIKVKEDKLDPRFAFGISAEDVISAAIAISVPNTGILSLWFSITGNCHFLKQVEINGCTISANTSKCFEKDGRLFPFELKIHPTEHLVDPRHLQGTIEHNMSIFDASISYMSVLTRQRYLFGELFKVVRREWKYGCTSIYDDTTTRIDEQKRIVKAIFHYDAGWNSQRWDSGINPNDSTEHDTFGYCAFRPFLSTGDLATPETIQKYLLGLEGLEV